MKYVEQSTLFDVDEFARWRDEWVGMPEFVQDDLGPWKTLIVHFANPVDMDTFAKLIGQKLTRKTQSVWYPEAEIGRYANKRYADES